MGNFQTSITIKEAVGNIDSKGYLIPDSSEVINYDMNIWE
jgi:hypothetical protein